MNLTKKLRLLTLVCGAGAALTAHAAKITSWTRLATTGMNTDYVPSSGFAIPNYDNQIVIEKNARLLGVNVWSNQYTYILKGATLVGNPTNTAETGTLYIQPGTVIRGYPPTTGADTTPGGLYVTCGSKMYARGTKDAPIIFTDMWDNNVPGLAAARGEAAAEQARLLEEIVKLDPLDGEALILLAQHHVRNSAPEKAIFLYERAEGIEKYEAEARLRHGQTLVKIGKYQEAVPLLKRALELKPRDDVQRYLEQVERAARARN